jgi:hypothetical protein
MQECIVLRSKKGNINASDPAIVSVDLVFYAHSRHLFQYASSLTVSFDVRCFFHLMVVFELVL